MSEKIKDAVVKTCGPDKSSIDIDEIRRLLQEQNESETMHTTSYEAAIRFRMLKNGDLKAVEESVNLIGPSFKGMLSKDPLRNVKYIFAVNTGIATSYMVEMGIPAETVFALSDSYIQRADDAVSIEEIIELTRESWTTYVELVKKHKSENTYSKPIVSCIEYIEAHFNERITLDSVAETVKLNPSYLATLFKKETGKTFGNYLMDVRIKTSEALLAKTDYSFSQIANSLAFCSQSHFTKAFHGRTGYTPKQYRSKFYELGAAKA